MTTEGSRVNRVRSPDGTQIACWTTGNGPPLVLVHGAAADHTRWRPLLGHLEQHFTVYALDRRGRGASGDGPVYQIAREYEDIAAVVDAVAAATKSKVDVYGHSHGGIIAFGAATLTSHIGKLVLYEGWPVPDPGVYALPREVEEIMDAMLAAGDREAVVEMVFRHLVLMSDEEMAAFKAAPSWPGRVAAAHTITREIRGETTALLDPAQAAKISVPVLLVTGETSSDPSKAHIEQVSAALADARTVVIEGQQHVADVMVPEIFARHLLAFLQE